MELYLLVLANEDIADRTIITIDGQKLRLTGPYAIDAIPQYACVSYVWGANRIENPLFPTHLMSDQTIPALQAVISVTSSEISAFWVDAFCIPYDQPAHSAILESMGYIYSVADRVVAALSPEYRQPLLEMTRRDWLAEELLVPFESNAWIASVWTYQEVVNAQKYFVTSMAPSTPAIKGDTFLNRIGYSLHKYKQSRDYSSFDIRRIWPHLDAFEDLGGDYMIYKAFQRPVLQIMGMLDRRVTHEERNKYYSMIGSLTAKRTGRNDAAGEGLAGLRKKAMSVCEEKGDWSFLYSSTARDETEPWMPSSGQELRSVLPFFIHGRGQSGRRDEEGRVWLEKVIVIRNVLGKEGEVDIAAIKDIISKLPLDIVIDANLSLDGLKEKVRSILTSGGFTGSGEEIIVPYGIFYSQDRVPVDVDVDVVICTELRWTFGYPGMIVTRGEKSTNCVPGVLVGKIGEDPVVQEYMLGSTGMNIASG
jgi:hypothetical protein